MGYVYTILQFIGLGLIFFTPPIFPQSIYGQVVLIISIFLGVWSIFVFRHTRINIFPYLRDGATLVHRGPYKYVRHPMYSSVLLFGLSYFIDNPYWLYAAYFLGLTVVIFFKIKFEEKQLASRFENYETDFFSTYRIIPCIY